MTQCVNLKVTCYAIRQTKIRQMKNKISFAFFGLFLISQFCFAQKVELKKNIDNIQKADIHYFECNSTYWKIVVAKKDAIPLLIEKLDDVTLTNANNKCKTGNLRVGDIAYLALTQILNLPLFEITKQQFDVIETNGCQAFVFDYIENNRPQFKKAVKNYYIKNKSKFKLKKFNPKSLNKCQKENKIFGYFDI